MPQEGEYLAGQTISGAQIREWVERFHRDGFLFLRNVLPPDWVAELKQDLDRALAQQPHGSLGGLIDECTRMSSIGTPRWATRGGSWGTNTTRS